MNSASATEWPSVGSEGHQPKSVICPSALSHRAPTTYFISDLRVVELEQDTVEYSLSTELIPFIQAILEHLNI